jgi:protocatechuate 3,4-dioxygenase beta subunit
LNTHLTLKLGLAALLAGGPALAASLEIEVRERGAGPVSNQRVTVYAVTAESAIPGSIGPFARPASWCTTGENGRCAVQSLVPGVYTVEVRPPADPNLSAPAGPPAQVFGTVTIRQGDAGAKMVVELTRGVRMQFRVVDPGQVLPKNAAVELSSDSDDKARAPIDTGSAMITLPAGRWIAHLAAPVAGLVVGVELDGDPVGVLDVPIELKAPSSDRYITWTLAPPCTIEGTVHSNLPFPGVEVGAEIVTPGPWGTSPFCRGVDCAGAPHGSPDVNGRYMINLPCGVWKVAPSGESLLESSPPFAIAELRDGQSTTLDFDVRETEGSGRGGVLSVRVVSPEGRPVGSVPVEVWPADGNASRDGPVATESTNSFGFDAWFDKLPAGSYLLRARVPGYRTAVEPLTDFAPEPSRARRMTIKLRRGAIVEASVKDDKDRPTEGVALTVARTDKPKRSDDPATRLAEDDDEITVPPSKDQTGRIIVAGLGAGTYRVRPAPSGTLAATAKAVIGPPGGKQGEETTVTLAEDGHADVDVRLLAAASLTGRLVCVDDGEHPSIVEACLLPPGAPDEDPDARDACRAPLVPVRSFNLTGEARDAFQVGPLSPGSVRVALRPRGYSAWTWALGTPDGSSAAVVQIEEVGAVDLGTIAAMCGPAIELRPAIKSKAVVPDLTLAAVTGSLTRKTSGGKAESRALAADRARDRVTFSELPEGDWTLEMSIEHPFFIPAAPARLTADVNLARGIVVVETPAVDDVGGAILLPAGAAAARLTPAEGQARVEVAAGGRVTLRGVLPGVYRVEGCGDARCAHVTQTWPDVAVARGRFTELAAP